MFHVLHNKDLGELEILEIYSYYDFPSIFSCRDVVGGLYIAAIAECSDVSDTWIYVKVSYDRLCLIHSGEIGLYEAFREPETGSIIRAIIPNELEDDAESGAIDPSELPDKMFPSKEDRLNIQGEIPMLIPEIDVLKTSKIMYKEAINVKFKGNGSYRGEAPIVILGKKFIHMQNTLNVIEAANSGYKTVTEDIKDRMELSVSSFYHGSFVVSVVSKQTFPENYYKPLPINIDSKQKKSISDFIDLIGCNYDEDMLGNILNRLKIKVIEEYRKFLVALKESESDIEFSWASPNSNKKKSVSLSMEDIPKIIEKLKAIEEEQQPTFNITGILVGLDVDEKTFAMRSDSDTFELEEGISRKKVKGDLLKDDPDSSVTSATINNLYKATIRPKLNKSMIIDENIKTDYTLLKLEPINMPTNPAL